MSKFYYQGQIQQENFLTPKDLLLRSIYGKYQVMILEASLILLFGISSLVIYFFDLDAFVHIPYIYARLLGAIMLFMAGINFATYYFILKRKVGSLIRFKAWVYLILGAILLIFPMSLNGILYRMLASIFMLIGFFTLTRRKNKSLFKIIVSVSLILVGLFFMFSPANSSYVDVGFYILMTVLGIYLLVNGLRFRSSLKKYEDEQKGFTDYSIE